MGRAILTGICIGVGLLIVWLVLMVFADDATACSEGASSNHPVCAS